MVAAIRKVTVAPGNRPKVPTESEPATAAVARRSLHWATDLEAGTTIAHEDLVVLRPGTGITPARAAEMVGGAPGRSTIAGAMVTPDDVETGE